jgi:hypothetical protein
MLGFVLRPKLLEIWDLGLLLYGPNHNNRQFEKKFRPAKAGLKKGKRKEGKRGKEEK